MANLEGNMTAVELGKKAGEILKPLRNVPGNSDGSIRPALMEGLDYLQEALRLATEGDIVEKFASFAVMSLPFHLSNASPQEFKYSIDRLTSWVELNYENANNGLARILTSEFMKDVKDRRLEWSDRKFADTIIGCNSTIGDSLSHMLHIPAVREIYTEKASEGKRRFVFALGTYYYELQDYSKAFELLKGLNDIYSAKYLGLMYFYGKGVSQDQSLAQKYLEQCHENIFFTGYEVIWALGEIYGRYDSKQRQFDLYIEELECRYRPDEDPFIKKMLKWCVSFKKNAAPQDFILMQIEIKPGQSECEFSLETSPYCDFSVEWGDGTCNDYGDLENRGTVKCRHAYSAPGFYTVEIESPWGKVIEGFDFSRYRLQLHSIIFWHCPGLIRLSITGQSLTNLDLIPGKIKMEFLASVICRDNYLTSLDLSFCPSLKILDCSGNPINRIRISKWPGLSKVCLQGISADSTEIERTLQLNQGDYCDPIDSDNVPAVDMRLEYYFRCARWNKVRKYIRQEERHYYDHNLAEIELTFRILKEMSKSVNFNPYEAKGGFLSVHESYVSDDDILHREEYFIKEESWATCLATKVRDWRRREPWMGFQPTPAEYFVANCLVNMFKNWMDLKHM